MAKYPKLTLKNDEQCPCCGRFANRGVSVDAVIVREKKVLLVKRLADPFKGFWATPGGYVGWDESGEDAVKREVKEETNLLVTNLQLLSVHSSPQRHPKQVINIVYAVEVEGSLKSGDDVGEAKWFSLDEIPELAFDHKDNISDFLNNTNANR